CHFINGTEHVRYVERHSYNREQFVHFDSDAGHYVGDTPFGEIQARYWNSQQEFMEYKQGQVGTFCWHNYDVITPFLVER
ncbi:HB2L protein, partial [Menura novaehollandiae]|nr:HB2L protein [Menura novaehollandiae]